MNKKMIGTISLATLIGLNALPVLADSVTPQGAVSQNHISFEANDDPSNPINPIDPDQPVDPSKPIDPDDPDNPGTGNEGPLTIDYISNIQFGKKEIKSGDTVYNSQNENPFVQVTDKRGTGEGWELMAQTSGFKTSAGKQLKGAELTFENGEIKTRPGNVSNPAVTHDVTFENEDAKLFMSADKDAGRGTWIDVFSGEHGNNDKIKLKVLEGSADANVEYTAKINWTLSNAPK